MIPISTIFERPFEPGRAYCCDGQAKIAGEARAMIGTDIVTEYEGRVLVLDMKKFIGYRVNREDTKVDVPALQMRLF